MVKKNLGGRPLSFTNEVVEKLEQAFAMDCSIPEACLYANISKETYYNHVNEKAEKNSSARKLFDRFESLRNRPFLKARQTIIKSLDNPQYATWYMERKRKNEFAQRQEMTGDKGGAITGVIILPSKNNDTQS